MDPDFLVLATYVTNVTVSLGMLQQCHYLYGSNIAHHVRSQAISILNRMVAGMSSMEIMFLPYLPKKNCVTDSQLRIKGHCHCGTEESFPRLSAFKEHLRLE